MWTWILTLCVFKELAYSELDTVAWSVTYAEVRNSAEEVKGHVSDLGRVPRAVPDGNPTHHHVRITYSFYLLNQILKCF